MVNMENILDILSAILPLAFLLGTISSDANFSLISGSKLQFTSAATITVVATYDKSFDQVRLDLMVFYSGTQLGGHTLFCTKADITAYTASGADDVLKFFNLCEQYTDNYLENLAENSTCTFTIT